MSEAHCENVLIKSIKNHQQQFGKMFQNPFAGSVSNLFYLVRTVTVVDGFIYVKFCFSYRCLLLRGSIHHPRPQFYDVAVHL